MKPIRCVVFTQTGGGARLSMFVLRDDAKKNGWVVISMKTDWKRIFAFEQ